MDGVVEDECRKSYSKNVSYMQQLGVVHSSAVHSSTESQEKLPSLSQRSQSHRSVTNQRISVQQSMDNHRIVQRSMGFAGANSTSNRAVIARDFTELNHVAECICKFLQFRLSFEQNGRVCEMGKRFICSFCNAGFTNNRNLRRHIRGTLHSNNIL